jgi:hypothetical protein
MAGQRDVEVRRRTLPLNYLCVCFAGNVSHPAKVRDGDISFMWVDSKFRASNQEGLAGLNNGGGH